MSTLREWLHRVAGFGGGGRGEADLEEELRLHLELAAEAAQRQGADPDEARRRARLEAGAAPQVMEALRDQRSVPWLEDLARDAGYALRSLRRSKGAAASAVVSLALGIGATAGIFSLVDQVLLRPLPVPAPDRLVQIDWVWRGGQIGLEYGAGSLLSYPVCRELQSQTELFEGVFCRHPMDLRLSSGQAEESVRAEIVSGAYFTALGVTPALGRLLGPDDERAEGAHPVVVLSHDYWDRQLGRPSNVLGRQVLVNGYPMTVVGVAQRDFRGVDLDGAPAVWIPAMMKRYATPEWDRLFNRRTYWLHVLGRLRPGVTLDAARQRLEPWAKAMLVAETRDEEFPAVSDELRARFLGSTVDLLPAARGVSNLRGSLQRPLRVLMTGTLLLLALAALNVAGLLLARGAARTRELTTRMALGASRGRVARQLLVESTLITCAGALLGVVLAPLVSRALRSFAPEGANFTAQIDGRVLLFAIAVSGATAVVCGLAPLLQANRLHLSAALTDRSGSPSRGSARLRKALVAGQLAFTILLLVVAGLFVQTVMRLQAKGAGFSGATLLMFGVDPTSLGYSYEESEQRMREVWRRLQTLPGVERVAIANTRVLNGGTSSGHYAIQADDRRVTDRIVHRMRVGPGFFGVLGTPVVAGRDFDARDTRAPGEEPRNYRTALVNETFARRYFGDRSPLGARIGSTNLDADLETEIIGVVREFTRRSLRDEDIDQIFFNYWDNQSDNGAFYVRWRGSPASALAPIRDVVAAVDPRLQVLEPTTFDAQIEQSLTTERALATLSGAFGAVALLISIVGVYGVMAFVAARRTQEIGVRLAFGATRVAAWWLVVREALLIVAAGAVVALPAVLALRRLIESTLFGVQTFDAPTIAGVSGGLAVVALAAAAVPAWRAAASPPMWALRDQPESLWQTTQASLQRARQALSVGSDRSANAVVALGGELGSIVARADSFAAAIDEALRLVQEHLDASFVLLFDRIGDAYVGDQATFSAHGALLNRLAHYPHPLPILPEDFEPWQRWAAAERPAHLPEIAALERIGVRLAFAVRTKSQIVGVLLIGAPRTGESFTAADRRLLRSIGETFALLLENAHLNARAIEQERLRRDLALAGEVQRRLLPAAPPIANASVAAFTQPARVVGGDYYDFIDLPDGSTGFAIADIAGKGIPAALLMSVVQASLRAIVTDVDLGCAAAATKMNRLLYQSTTGNGYATFFYARIDTRGKRLEYVNAGHNPPLLVRRGAAATRVAELSAGGTVLGLFADMPYEAGQTDLQAGDLLVAFTDGVTEARNAAGDEFGDEQLKALLCRTAGAPADAVSAVLADEVRRWSAGAEQHDDITFVVVVIQ